MQVMARIDVSTSGSMCLYIDLPGRGLCIVEWANGWVIPVEGVYSVLCPLPVLCPVLQGDGGWPYVYISLRVDMST